MKRTSNLLLLLTLLIFSSCGEQKADEEKDQDLLGNPNNYTFREPIRAATEYDAGEMVVAKSVCEAFQRKRARITTGGGSVQFNLKVKNQTCNITGPTEQRTLGTITQDRAGDLTLRAANRSVTVMNDVYSDQHPRIKKICESVLAGKAPQNTIQDGALRYQVNFFQAASYEWVQIAEFSEFNGTYYPYLIERGAVITEYAREDRGEIGFVRSRTANRPCNNLTRGQYLSQEIL